mmetsp:Transcript_23292/g.55022  ORF Transcript_23292/g.55022 Transcript_23292/m.55022 type:complete len:258 (-) Transcript_23292:445-1218(-)
MARLVEVRVLYQHQSLQRNQHLEKCGLLRIPARSRPSTKYAEANLAIVVEIRVQLLTTVDVVCHEVHQRRLRRVLGGQGQIKEERYVRVGRAGRTNHHCSKQVASGRVSTHHDGRNYAFSSIEKTLLQHRVLSPHCSHQHLWSRRGAVHELVIAWAQILLQHIESQDFWRSSRRGGAFRGLALGLLTVLADLLSFGLPTRARIPTAARSLARLVRVRSPLHPNDFRFLVGRHGALVVPFHVGNAQGFDIEPLTPATN